MEDVSESERVFPVTVGILLLPFCCLLFDLLLPCELDFFLVTHDQKHSDTEKDH